MYVVSMVRDHYYDKWHQWPWNQPIPITQPTPNTNPPPMKTMEEWQELLNPPVRKSDLDALRKEVEEMKALLNRALEYDKKNNEPHCEMEEKVALLKAVAKMVGVDLSEVFGKND